MAVLFKCIFQGDPQFGGTIGKDAAAAVAREAFPLSPPASAVSDPGYSSFKIAPAGSGQLLIAVTKNRGERDRFGRSVLTATGCVMQLAEMRGPLREVPTLWRIVNRDNFTLEWDAFQAAAMRESLHEGTGAFERVVSALSAHGAFHAQVAYALVSNPTTIHMPERSTPAELLEPAFALLPLGWIGRLHFATGATESSGREPAIGTTEAFREPQESGSRWRLGPRREPVIVDLTKMQVRGLNGNPLAGVAAAIVDPYQWPGFDARTRYGMITQCLDSPVIAGRNLSPFDLAPNLDVIRRGVRSAETFALAAQNLPKSG